MRLSESEYRALVVHSPVLIWRAGLDTNCDYFNETWLAFTGRTLEEEIGVGWASGVHPDDFQRCVDYYLDHFHRREAFEMEYRLRRHDGEFRWILDRGAPFYDDAGTFAGFIGSCIDIDERRRAQELQAERGARQLAGAQEFEQWILGIVSHDIRNPLSSVVQGVEVLRMTAHDPAAVLRTIERIGRGGERIRHLVDDLLDMTRERQGGIPIEKQQCDLSAVCREVVEELTATAAGRSIELSCASTVTGFWDPHRVAQAISNLVGNAIQHGLPGTPIRVAVDAGTDELTVTVHNAGTIPPERMSELFTPFKTSSAGARRTGGLGLGLFIAQAIARAHGGTIDVESTAEAGTTFRLRLPRTQTP